MTCGTHLPGSRIRVVAFLAGLLLAGQYAPMARLYLDELVGLAMERRA